MSTNCVSTAQGIFRSAEAEEGTNKGTFGLNLLNKYALLPVSTNFDPRPCSLSVIFQPRANTASFESLHEGFLTFYTQDQNSCLKWLSKWPVQFALLQWQVHLSYTTFRLRHSCPQQIKSSSGLTMSVPHLHYTFHLASKRGPEYFDNTFMAVSICLQFPLGEEQGLAVLRNKLMLPFLVCSFRLVEKRAPNGYVRRAANTWSPVVASPQSKQAAGAHIKACLGDAFGYSIPDDMDLYVVDRADITDTPVAELQAD